MKCDRAMAMLAALTLAACASEGDLGRYKPTEVDHVRALFDGGRTEIDLPDSTLGLTEDEKTLRSLAVTLTLDKGDLDDQMTVEAWWDALRGAAPKPAVYYQRLKDTHADAPHSMLSAFTAHVQVDVARIERFASQSGTVRKADAERLAAVRGVAHAGTFRRGALIGRATDVIYRIGENGRVIDGAIEYLGRQIDAYRYALVRARLEVPEPSQIEAIGREIGRMETQLAGLRKQSDRHAEIVENFFGGTQMGMIAGRT